MDYSSLFKIRCSAIYSIMGGTIGASESQLKFIKEMEAREKPMTDNMREKYNGCIDDRDNPKPTAGMKSYCEDWLKEQIYGIKKNIKSKYLDKGNASENEAIEFIESYYRLGFIIKNEQHFEDKYKTGTPDIIRPRHIRDTKCSWDAFSFPLFEKKLDPQYWWQVQGYMDLTKKKLAYVDYVLVNTPEEIDFDAHDYSNVAKKYRVKSFKVKRDDAAIKEIAVRVKMCRNYIKELQNLIK